MKLIIDIPEERLNSIKGFGIKQNEVCMLERALISGTPLDDVKAEIKKLRDSWEKDCYHDEAEALDTALRIIDKHMRGKAESEEE